MANHTATVETLTAEVRVLMVGSRQVTLSVYRQLDTAALDDLELFGRVRDPSDQNPHRIDVVGRHRRTGTLCRATHSRHPNSDNSEYLVFRDRSAVWLTADEAQPLLEIWDDLERLPLIVLAGLR